MFDRALTFLETANRPVELAWARVVTRHGDVQTVTEALATYQNPDGGFGQHLEIDIHAPDSHPFAARLAMQVLISIGTPSHHPIVQRLTTWLEREQGDDGCWRFPPGIYEHELAPWFAGWTFPSLNPALNLAGAARQLGIGSDRLFARVSALVDRLASREEIETGEFYTVLPYVEHFPWIDHPQRQEFLDALAARITASAKSGNYADADHFFGHVGPAKGDLAKRLDPSLISTQLTKLRNEQQADGGWPSPYSPDWRPWITAQALATLIDFGER